MDNYCIQLGYLLDNSAVTTLLNPEVHSVHWYVQSNHIVEHVELTFQDCVGGILIADTLTLSLFGFCLHSLVDVQVCRESPYELLGDPVYSGQLYSRAFRVEDSGKSTLISLARSVGAQNPSGGSSSCQTCTNATATLATGFRAQVRGTVTAGANGEIPPIISLTEATHSNGLTASVICAPVDLYGGGSPAQLYTMGPIAWFPSPTDAPTYAPVAATDAPVALTDAPVALTEAPVAPTNTPVAPTEAPSAPTNSPVAPTKAPIAQTEAPVASTEAPATMTKAPEVSTKSPVVDATPTPMAAPALQVADTQKSGLGSGRNGNKTTVKLLSLVAVIATAGMTVLSMFGLLRAKN
jgi:hypothetical protein